MALPRLRRGSIPTSGNSGNSGNNGNTKPPSLGKLRGLRVAVLSLHGRDGTPDGDQSTLGP